MNMTLAGTWDGNNTQTSGVFYNDIWGYTDESGNEYAILGSPNEVHFIDVTNPSNPTEILGHVGGSTSLWRDFKTYKKYAYGVADQGSEGLLIFDLSALPSSPPTLANQNNSDFQRAHNIFIDVPNGLAYIAGSNTVSGGVIVYDLNANPTNPPVVYSSNLQGGYVHDIYVRDNIAYASHGNNGLYMHDFSNPSSPVFIDSRNTGGYNHSSWLTDDGQYAVYAEEVPQGRPLGILDLTDVPNNGIGLVTTFKFPLLAPQATGVTPHNPFIAGDYCIVSYYEDGVQIFDISDKNNPFTAAYYDTDPNNTSYSGTDDNWGVYPYFPSGTIIASDTKGGLFVLSTSLNIPTTCFDGIKNGTELGVDCGGFCKPCGTAPQAPVAGFSANTTTSCTGVIEFTDLSSTNATSWAWDFGDGNTSTLQNPTHTYTTAGTYTVSLTATNVIGSDTDSKTNYVTITTPAAPTAAGGDFCAPGSTTLNASTQSGQINWYDNNGNYITTGTSYTTPTLNNTTTYYVETTSGSGPQYFGPQDGSIGGGGYHGASAQYLEFTVTQDVTLVSVWVDADQTGNRTIELRDGFGTLINSLGVNIPNGISRVALNLNLTPGNYQLGGDNMDLFRNNNGPNYPYSISNLIEITGSSAGGNYYYYFYDWEVQTAGCTSAQTQVTATALALPTSSFSGSVSGNTVTFTNTSSNAAVWLWDFGDGNNSVLEDPTHTFANGTYTVLLTSTSSCGQDTSSQTFTFGAPPVADFSQSLGSGCSPLTVSFTDLSVNTPSSWSWSFPGGIPSTSTQANPTIVYNNAGTYDVTLVVSNSLGSDTKFQGSALVVSGPPATAGFTSTTNNLTVDFTNSSTGNITTYFWDFGDGNNSSLTNPSHTYSAPGSYIVVLTVTNSCGSKQSTQTINVGGAPTSSFSAIPTTGCAPLTVNYTDNSVGSPTSWSWSFPGGTPSTSTQQNPTVVYNNSGTFDVTLAVGNSIGSDVSTQNSYIVVNDVPVVGFTASNTGNTVTFTNTTTSGSTYSWDFGDGNTSTQTNPSHTYSTAGTYTVVLTATNACGTQQSTQTISVGSGVPPSAGFMTNTNVGCTPLTVNFSDNSSGNPTAWSWSFPGGTPSTSTVQNPTVTYNNTGAYDVILTVSNANGTDVYAPTGYILVFDQPAASFTTSISGTTVTFINNSTNATTYNWDLGDGNTNSSVNPTHTYSAPGIYTVVLNATNNCGTVTNTQTITVGGAPSPAFSSSASVGCAPFTVNYTDNSTGGPTNWNWSFPGGTPSTSTQQNPSVVYSTVGNYDVTLEVSNSLGTNSNTLPDFVVVNDLPTTSFNQSVSGTTVNFINNSTNATSYSWSFGDGNSSTAVNPTHTYAAPGTYNVLLTASNSCGSLQFTQTVTVGGAPNVVFSANNATGCAPLIVSFTDQSTGSPTSWSWSFPGGAPATSTLQNPQIQYTAAGTYDVTLTAINALGSNTSTQMSIVVVNDGPTAAFSNSISGFTVILTNTSSNATSYSWNFGDGNSSTANSPSHTYSAPGNYPVTLTATNACGSITTTQTVTIGNPPSANFTSNVNAGCAPLTVNFSDLSNGSPTSWIWSFPGGTPSSSTMQNPTVTYSSGGTFDVVLTVANAIGNNSVTQTGYVLVNTAPTASFNSSITGNSVSFVNNTTGAFTYNWDFGDGNTSAQTNPIHTYAAPGSYTVVLTAVNACGSNQVSTVVTVGGAPIAAFDANMTSGCSPMTVTFSDLSTNNPVAWSWSFPGGTPSTSVQQNPTVTYNGPGTYDVTLTSGNAIGSNTTTQTGYIIVSASPSANFNFSTSVLTTIFTNTSSNATSYNWNFGDGNTSTVQNPTHTYGGPGTYTVSLTASNACGSVTTTQSVVIGGAAPIPGMTSNPNTGCAPLVVSFTDQSSGSPTNWSWSFPGGTPATSTMQNPTVTYSTLGAYDVLLTVSNAFGSTSNTYMNHVVVNDKPIANFVFSVTNFSASFTNTTFSGTSYLWDFGDGNTSTQANPVHSYTANGTYTVTLTATNACGTSVHTETVVVSVSTGLEEENQLTSLTVMPNPNSGLFQLEVSGKPIDQLELQVLNVVGIKVFERTVDFSSGRVMTDIDLGVVPSGTYILAVRRGADIAYRKLTIID